jgi:hypothetical protein
MIIASKKIECGCANGSCIRLTQFRDQARKTEPTVGDLTESGHIAQARAILFPAPPRDAADLLSRIAASAQHLGPHRVPADAYLPSSSFSRFWCDRSHPWPKVGVVNRVQSTTDNRLRLLACMYEYAAAGILGEPSDARGKPNHKTRRDRINADRYRKKVTNSFAVGNKAGTCETTFAAMCGELSGGLAVAKFSNRDVLIRWIEAVPDLAMSLPIHLTDSGGNVLYRSDRLQALSVPPLRFIQGTTLGNLTPGIYQPVWREPVYFEASPWLTPVCNVSSLPMLNIVEAFLNPLGLRIVRKSRR